MSSLIRIWGTEPHERLLSFPCDRFIDHFNDVYYRGITIQAKPEIVFQWLCQMRIAPYSYDWIDNFGHQSPQEIVPGLDELEIGQEVMTIFELVDFTYNENFTIRLKKDMRAYKFFGDAAVSYVIIPKSTRRCRLLVKLLVQYPKRIAGMLLRSILPLGDLIMMRRQLLNFKKLSEQKKDGIPS